MEECSSKDVSNEL